MYGQIYKITNKINGHCYIGQTIMSLKERFQRHCSHSRDQHPKGLHAAMKKYGIDNFIIEQIDTAESFEELNELEIKWIKYYNTFNGKGYNLTLGGQGAQDLKIELPIDSIIIEYNNGATLTSLGEKYNCSNNTIKNRLISMGIEIDSNRSSPAKKQAQKDNFDKGRIGGRPENFKAHIESLKKGIIQFDPETQKLIKVFSSLSDACKSLGTATNHTNRMSKAAKEGKLHLGYRWILIEDLPKDFIL